MHQGLAVRTTPNGVFGSWVQRLVCQGLQILSNGVAASAAGLETKLERLMAAKGSSFEKEVAYRASQAAGEADTNVAWWC